eukprot:bmy_00373T0
MMQSPAHETGALGGRYGTSQTLPLLTSASGPRPGRKGQVGHLIQASPKPLLPPLSPYHRAQNPKWLEHWGIPRQTPRWTRSSGSGMKPLPRSGQWRLSWTYSKPSCELWRPSCWKFWRRS